ncbi:MAG: adenylate/guanylate cyclase domain-containing protein [Pseudomonadota bacterium]
MSNTNSRELAGPYAVLFAHVGGSAPLYEELGNTFAIDIVTESVAALSAVTRAHGGRVIKFIDDEVMCVFTEAEHAALAACDMQVRIQELEQESTGPARDLQARVGAHYGMVLDEGKDVFGDTVNTAARIAALCKPEQILVTAQFVSALPRELKQSVRFHDEVDLRGKQDTTSVHEILWEVSDVTVAGDNVPKIARLEHETCTVLFGDQLLELGNGRPHAAMGRADDVEIQCRGALTSRHHARIEYRRGRFVLTDQSSNGTFVRPDGEPVLTLKRDYYTLTGSGMIGLGEAPETDDPLTVFYRCS